MNDKIQIKSNSPDETKKLGKIIGSRINNKMVILLSGDLGSGKTCFVQGLATGLEVPEEYYITSPTYTIINEYTGRYSFFHIDLYRISDLSELEDLGFDEIMETKSVIAIEWSERIADNKPAQYLSVQLIHNTNNTRIINITGNNINLKPLLQDDLIKNT